MGFLKRIGDLLSADWWIGLGVIVASVLTVAGIVVGSILTFGIFRLTESNLDLAETNLDLAETNQEEARQQRVAEVHVAARVYVPMADGLPELEGPWLAEVHVVNYGPAPANAVAFFVDLAEIDETPAMYMDPRTIRVFDSSLNEIPNGVSASVEVLWSSLRVRTVILPPGESLQILIEGTPVPWLVQYANEVHRAGLLFMRTTPEVPGTFLPPDSAESPAIQNCVFAGGFMGGLNIEGSLSPSGDWTQTEELAREFHSIKNTGIITREGATVLCPWSDPDAGGWHHLADSSKMRWVPAH